MNICVSYSSKAPSCPGGRRILATVVVFFQDDEWLNVWNHPAMRQTAGLPLRLILLRRNDDSSFRMLCHPYMNMEFVAGSSPLGPPPHPPGTQVTFSDRAERWQSGGPSMSSGSLATEVVNYKSRAS